MEQLTSNTVKANDKDLQMQDHDAGTDLNFTYAKPDNAPNPATADMVRFFDLVYVPGNCVELRVIGSGGPLASGYFNDRESFLKAAAGCHGRGNVYATVNPVKQDLLARSANRLTVSRAGLCAGIQGCYGLIKGGADDDDITGEYLFFIDIDPVRPSGISATDDEMQHALDKAAEIQQWLKERGVDSVRAMSGNGAYVLVRLSPRPFTQETRDNRRDLLGVLAERFSDGRAKIDTDVYNPSRICKVLGTLAMKGDHCPEIGRPHRVSHFTDNRIPSESDLYDALQRELSDCRRTKDVPGAKTAPGPQNAVARPAAPGDDCTGKGGGSAEAVTRARAYLNAMPPAVSGQGGHNTTFRAAMVLAEGFGLDQADAEPLLREYSSRCQPPWSERELAHKLDDAYKKMDLSKRGYLLNAEPACSTGLPILKVPGGRVRIIDTAETLGRIMRAAGRYVVHAGDIVKLNPTGFEKIDDHAMRSEIETVCSVVRMNGGNAESTVMSLDHVKSLCKSPALLDMLPRLQCLTNCPILVERPDGRLEAFCGFDPATGIYAAGGDRTMDLPDIETAKQKLLELAEDYDFESPADKSRFIANMITPAFIFSGIGGFRGPLQYVQADKSQAGKGYMHRLIAAVYGAKTAPVNRIKRGTGSLEESINAAIIRGERFITCDNLTPKGGVFDSEPLCSLLTEDSYTARAAYSKHVTVDPTRLVIMATTNGCSLSQDMFNRCCTVRIRKRDGHAFRAYPEGDLLEHVRAHSHDYLAAVYSLICEWDRRHRPKADVTLDTYLTRWAQVIDWIVTEQLGLPSITDGWGDIGRRSTSSECTWLTACANTVEQAGRTGQWLSTTDLLDLLNDRESDLLGPQWQGIPGARNGSVGARELGRWLHACFNICADEDGTAVTLDMWRIDYGEGATKKVYQYTDRAGEKSVRLAGYKFIRHGRGKGKTEGAVDTTAAPGIF